MTWVLRNAESSSLDSYKKWSLSSEDKEKFDSVLLISFTAVMSYVRKQYCLPMRAKYTELYHLVQLEGASVALWLAMGRSGGEESCEKLPEENMEEEC